MKVPQTPHMQAFPSWLCRHASVCVVPALVTWLQQLEQHSMAVSSCSGTHTAVQ